jgi:hypothetical protein
MIQIKSPNSFIGTKKTAFLGGSIEMGTAENWQARLVNDFENTNITFLNPRRDDWDSNWKQEASNPQFHEQVTWELDALEFSELIIFYFDPNTKSPITLMELGLFAASEKVIVCCPDGFWRKGNVEIVCQRNNIPMVNTFDELVKKIRSTSFFSTVSKSH